MKFKNPQPGNRFNKATQKSRKVLRKEKRNVKKQNRRDYYARRSKNAVQNAPSNNRNWSAGGGGKIHNVHNYSEEGYKGQLPNVRLGHDESKRMYGNNDGNLKFNDTSKARIKEKAKSQYQDPLVARKMQEDAAHRKLQEGMRETRNLQLQEANEEEEKLIKRLEKQLKLSKRKSKSVPKSFAADGLDYLLDVCDSDKIKDAANVEKALENSDSELEEDLAAAVSAKDSSSMQVDEDDIFVRPSTSGLNNKPNKLNSSDNAFLRPSTSGLNYKPNKLQSSGASDNGINASGYESDSDFVESEAESDHYGSSVYDSGDSGKNDFYRDEYYGSEEEHLNSARRTRNTSESSMYNDSVDEKKSENTRTKRPLKSKKIKNVRFREDDEDDEDSGRNESTNEKSKLLPKRMKILQKGKRSSDAMDTTTSKSKKLRTKENFDEPGRYVRMHHSEDSDANGDVSDVEGSVCEGGESSSFWEDIYGRLRDEAGNVLPNSSQPGAYIPPALRAQQSVGDEFTQQRLQRLKRQIKGYLNRLTESNLPSISSELDLLYSNNSRNDMNSTFTGILLESMVSSVLSLERLIMEHVALVACLHSKVGSDVGAFVLQSVVKQFDLHFKENPDIENKQLDNLILIICYLYLFKVVHARLVFDVLQCLSGRFNSKDLELILLMLRSVGFGLRKDDPSAMKSLMIQLQELANTSLQECSESRVKFMLEVLVAVKNNNMARLPGWDPSPVDNMRKLLRSLLASGNTSPELNISLQDLLLADERGRWWVVGSAWAGQAPGINDPQVKTTKPVYSAKLLELAEQMRMNTELRRNIFCIIMSAQDYTEAFKNLMQLGLKGLPAREIVHVSLDCCLQEKTYNKFYAHILESFCKFNRIYKMTLQCDIWNKIEDLRILSETQFSNLVKLLQQLLTQGVLSLIVFKVIDMTRLEKPTVRFLRQVLLGILSCGVEECNEVFVCVTKHPKYKMFSRKLHVFLQQYVLSKMSEDDPQRAFFQERVEGIFSYQDL